MTAQQIVEKLESLSMQVIDLDEFTPEQWQAFRTAMGDVLRILGGAKKPHVQQARQALAKAFMKLKQEDYDTHEPFTEQLDAMKKALGGAPKPKPEPEDGADDEDDEIFADYVTELAEFIEQLETAILELEGAPDDPECIHSVFRLFHTIKGTAGVMQHHKLGRLAHQAENLLDQIRDGARELKPQHIDLFLAALDLISETHSMFSPTQRKDMLSDESLTQMHEMFEAAMNEDDTQAAEPQPPEPEPESVIEPEPAPEPEVEPQQESVVEQEPEVTHEPEPESVIEPEPAVEPAPEEFPEEAPEPVEESAPGQQEIEGEEKPIVSSGKGDATIRIDTRKLDNLIDLVGELVISANLVREDEMTLHTNNLEFRKKVSQLSAIVDDLQRTSMGLRMIPIGGTLQRMKRVVRDISSSHQKDIDLQINGQETEIDRHIVDRLYEPLVHLVRNACDHGIESPEARLAAGKPEMGTVTLTASHLGNNIIIDITDDGQGLDPQAIRAKAKEKGLLQEGDTLDDKDVWRLVLVPGFSTAETVSDISGRGVGMDVVNRAVQDLGGHIEVTSEKGAGSNFRVSLPLTLAILEGMLVRVGGELFVIPVMNVHRIIHPQEEALSQVFGKGELIKDGERLLPLSRLYEIFDLEASSKSLEDTVLVIVSSLRRTFALMVDELVGIQDVVVKSLGPKFRDLRGVSGSTILGDGSVGFILDINNLLPEDQS